LAEQFTFELTNAFGKQFSVWNGGVRVYLPGVDVNGDPFAHPLTTSDRISRISGGVDRLRQQTAELVIAHTAAAARTAAGAALSHAKLESLLVRAGLIREAPTRVSFAEVVAVRPELPRQTVAPAAPPPLVPTDSEQPDVAAAFERQRSVPQAAPQTFVEVKPWAALDAEQPDVDYGSGFP
jgi:hypothetical protein